MILYTRNQCKACYNVKQFLTAAGVEWTEVNIEEEPEKAMALVTAGIRTVPVLENEQTGERIIGAAAIQASL